MKKLINKLREIKVKPSKDNYFDIAIGAVLACIGLWVYLNTKDMDKVVIIALPALVSFLKEIVNIIECKKFNVLDMILRVVVGVILYLIV